MAARLIGGHQDARASRSASIRFMTSLSTEASNFFANSAPDSLIAGRSPTVRISGWSLSSPHFSKRRSLFTTLDASSELIAMVWKNDSSGANACL